MDIAKGVTVCVVRGKKVPVGTMGVVVWSGPGHYGPRVGIKPAGGGEAVFTDAKNVDVVGAGGVAPAPAPQAALPFDTDAGAVATLQARIAALEALLPRLEALEALAAKAAARRAAAAPVAA